MTTLKTVKQIAKTIPGLPQIYYPLKLVYERSKARNKGAQKIFDEIFIEKRWGDKESISGPGSSLIQTQTILKELPLLFRQLNVSSLLDIPCGDFNWMSTANLDGIAYTGADIVHQIVEQNQRTYAAGNIQFRRLDLIADSLPKADLVLCRDCLVHICFKDVLAALNNICKSGSRYLLTTTFPSRAKNQDIPTGSWCPLNLQIAPFSLPEPVRCIKEECTEMNGTYNDKCLALWEIDKIRLGLAARQKRRIWRLGS
jgi:hypothetical protein